MKIIGIIVLGIVLLGGLFLLSKSNRSTDIKDESQSRKITQTPIEAKTFEIEVKNKELVFGHDVLNVIEGDEVIIKILVDEEEELHIHGYDKSVDLEKDKQGTLKFTANRTGRFPFELERSKIEIGALEVQPK